MSDGTITILVVEDEVAIRDMIGMSLERAGFQWLPAGSTEEARRQLVDKAPDLMLLDWMLPGTSGLDFAKQLRRDDSTRDLPVIMLTARDAEEDMIRGLEGGVDDYLTKPFSTRELIARIKTVLRRAGGADETPITLGPLTLEPSSHRVRAGQQKIELGPTEYRLLQFFMRHPERVYAREQLLDRVWGRNVYIDDRTVDVHIRRLRKALEPHQAAGLIQTVRGAGYRFSTQS
ncbi:MAG TPA: phosphate regulon transcriptional regulatory protein PhoB [Gammaproteobacteria bacterium]|nr:phosphate regulon transcriptional regulatory protein PhoB [Gammaproteobacteria bacterium]